MALKYQQFENSKSDATKSKILKYLYIDAYKNKNRQD